MMEKVIVLTEFADKDNISKRYKVGEELVGFSEERIANLVERGLAGYESETAAEIDLSAKCQRVVAQVKACEDIERLRQYLETEKASEKPRESVVKAIEERIASLADEK